MISPSKEQPMMLFFWSLLMMFPCNSLHMREHKFTPAIGENFMGHRLCTHWVPLTCKTLTQSFPFLVIIILPEFSCTNLLIMVISKRLVSSFVMWHNVPESPLHMFFVNMWYVSPSMVHIIPASVGILTSFTKQIVLFSFSFYTPTSAYITPNWDHHCQQHFCFFHFFSSLFFLIFQSSTLYLFFLYLSFLHF